MAVNTFESYPIIKKFIQTSETSDVQRGGNGITSFDDPTYLGFDIRFDIDSPLFRDAIAGETEKSNSDATPSVENDNIQSSQTRFNKIEQSAGAVGYLESVGEYVRANYLRAFIQGLREVANTRKYYFQTIEGLSSAYEKATIISEDPYIGTKGDEGIVIGCLEAIDLKMTALMNLYRSAVYDVRYKRFVLPKNLMYFNVIVDVYEIRNFIRGASINRENGERVSEFINENTSNVSFKFIECTWMPAESARVFDNVTNVSPGLAATAIKWNYGDIFIDSSFSGYGDRLDEQSTARMREASIGKNKVFADSVQANIPGAIQSEFDSVINRAQENLNPENILSTSQNRADRAINSIVQNDILGNVFGLRGDLLGVINNPQAFTSAIEGAILQNQTVPGINSLGERILPPGFQPTNSNGLNPPTTSGRDNLFGPSPSGPPPLDSTNIFE